MLRGYYYSIVVQLIQAVVLSDMDTHYRGTAGGNLLYPAAICISFSNIPHYLFKSKRFFDMFLK